MKQGILLVSVSSGKENGGVEQIKSKICKKFPQILLYQAFTGKRFQENEFFIGSVLKKMKQDGIEQGYLVPLYLLNGIEYEGVLQKIEESKLSFQKEVPFLCKKTNMQSLATIFKEQCHKEENTFWVYVGHGTTHQADCLYQELTMELQDRQDILIATLEGKINLNTIVESFKNREVQTVHLMPLMLCGGKHLEKDIIGEQGWKQTLVAKGYKVICHTQELTMLPQIQQLYLQQLEKMIDGMERKDKNGF